MKTEMREYQVMKPFWFVGILQEVGARLTLTDAQVKYMGDEIAPVKAEAVADAAQEQEPKRRRASRDEATAE